MPRWEHQAKRAVETVNAQSPRPSKRAVDCPTDSSVDMDDRDMPGLNA